MLNIADLIISVEASSGIILETGNIKKNFVTGNDHSPDINIKVFTGIPNITITTKCIFSSTDCKLSDSNLFTPYIWNIYKTDRQGIIRITKKDKSARTFAVIIFNEHYNKWKIFFPCSEQKIKPLEYPIGPLIMYYITNAGNGIMLHASAIIHKTKGLVFTGFSGAGKTTMAWLWKNFTPVINDDRIIIRWIKNKFFIYNTPLYADDLPKKAELSKIFIIRHSSENQLKRIYGTNAIARTMAFCIQHNYNNKLIERMTDVIAAIVNNVPVYELGFVSDTKIIDFILKST
ncbi:MAG: hypothetical protein HY738_22070 [Bacteroidia bacterium]|nr:hypothetical protein [Bacteroidia bacterium]